MIFNLDKAKACRSQTDEVIIVEGYKNENIPKLEVFRREIGKAFLYKDDTNIKDLKCVFLLIQHCLLFQFFYLL